MTERREFDTAPMALLFALMTGLVLFIPIAFVAVAYRAPAVRVPMLIAGGLVFALSIVTWLVARPRRFVVDADGLTVEWPLWHRHIPRAAIKAARVLDDADVKATLGTAARVGVGGLFGVFGLLKTSKLGWVSCYITTTAPLVLVERASGRPLLISPTEPEALARLLRS
ncbi:MAG TPA: PH domain-containing protein [Polyangiaceae bacterium]|nr:PH domain-containing protein [Polyangiaceae bacterium]